MCTPVVAHKKDNGVVCKSFVIKPLENSPYLPVQNLYTFKVECPILTDKRIVWIVGRQGNVIWGNGTRRVWFKDAVRVGDVNLRVKGLSFGAFTPIYAVKRIFALEVKIGFSAAVVRRSRAIARKIAGFSEAIGDEFHIGAQGFLAIAPMVMRVKMRLIRPGDERGAARGADRGGDESVGITSAFGGEPVDVRCFHDRCAVTAEVWGKVFPVNPEDVGSLGCHGFLLNGWR